MGVVVVTQRVVGARARQVRRLRIVETGDQPAQARQRLGRELLDRRNRLRGAAEGGAVYGDLLARIREWAAEDAS